MRLATSVSLFLFLSSTTVHSETPPQLKQHHQQLTRRERLFRDFGVAFSGIFPREAERRVIKRAAVNVKNQCVLRPVGGFPTPKSSGGGGTTTTHGTTAAGGATTTGKSSTSTTTTSKTTTTTSSKTTGGASSTATSAFTKQFDSSGSDFFDNWTFFADADPTHGNVQYTTQADAQAAGLIDIDSNGHAFMRMELTPVVAARKSVRIETKQTFTGGLWVLDAVHMPSGCGTWPAWWTHGPNWPENGEIDILEGVNGNTFNQAALHVKDAGCSITPEFGGTGSIVGTVCASSAISNNGCGIVDNKSNTYGAGFNSNNGGMYTMLWDATGISVWFFPRGSIPKDLIAEAPQPSSWGTPFALFPASTCEPFTYNKAHTTIFDTTLCGDWAGGTWDAAPNGGGPSCAAQTGVATCAEYVQNNGAAFAEAYWEVKSMKIYQTTPMA